MRYPKTTWRLIESPPSSGAWNMSVDEALLEGAFTGTSQPTLRLYAWQPACLSLGYAQPYSEVDPEALATKGWDIVRRPTGGRAILHVDELTYAVIAPETDPRVAGGVLESYLRLSEALLEALQLLGLSPEANEKMPEKSKGKFNPVCFEVPSNYEITVNGKKLIGSAQARRKGGILQHGVLPLFGDLTRILTALKFVDEPARKRAEDRLLAHATTVERELGAAPDWQQAAEAFKKAFQNVLNLNLVPGELTPMENNRTKELMAQKFGHASWTQRI